MCHESEYPVELVQVCSASSAVRQFHHTLYYGIHIVLAQPKGHHQGQQMAFKSQQQTSRSGYHYNSDVGFVSVDQLGECASNMAYD